MFLDYGETCEVSIPRFLLFIHYLWLRQTNGVDIYDYFNNRLFDKSVDHTEYYASLNKNIHKWKNLVHKYAGDKSAWWRFSHRLDYLLGKVLYPGLDAMDYFRYEFFNFSHAKRKTFVTEGYLAKMDRALNGGFENSEALSCLSSKVKFNHLFADYIGRKWFDAETMSWEEFEAFCAGMDRVIVKPMESCGGKGIYIYELKDGKRELFDQITGKHFIVEEVLVQHESLKKLNPSSVNTVRVYTVLHKDEVTITAAILRVGSGTSVTDNYSTGGLVAKIDLDTGLVVSRAVTQTATTTFVHPMTKQPIIGFQVPQWDVIKKKVEEMHKRIKALRYVGWDAVICEDGRIVFLEANTFAGVDGQQHPALEGKKELYDSLMKE